MNVMLISYKYKTYKKQICTLSRIYVYGCSNDIVSASPTRLKFYRAATAVLINTSEHIMNYICMCLFTFANTHITLGVLLFHFPQFLSVIRILIY